MLKRILDGIVVLVWLCACGLLAAIPWLIGYENLDYQKRYDTTYAVIFFSFWVVTTAILALLSGKVLDGMKELMGIIYDRVTEAMKGISIKHLLAAIVLTQFLIFFGLVYIGSGIYKLDYTFWDIRRELRDVEKNLSGIENDLSGIKRELSDIDDELGSIRRKMP